MSLVVGPERPLCGAWQPARVMGSSLLCLYEYFCLDLWDPLLYHSGCCPPSSLFFVRLSVCDVGLFDPFDCGVTRHCVGQSDAADVG